MRDPIIGILAGLSHPDGHIILFAKVEVLSQYGFVRGRPIFVKGVGNVGIERFAKDGKIGVPLRATKKENVVSVYLSYLGRQLLVERFQKIIQRPKPGKMGDRLIQEVITEHGGLIAIVRCQPAPDGDQVLLLLRTLV